MSIIQASISSSWLPLRHIPDHVAPYFLRGQFADPGSRHGFNIDRLPFLDPMMLIFLAGKSQMHHLMGRYPVVSKIGSRAFPTYTNPNMGSVPARGVPAAHSSPEMERNINTHLLHRIPSIIINDRF